MESIQIITVASYTYGNALLSTAEVYNMKLLDLPQHCIIKRIAPVLISDRFSRSVNRGVHPERHRAQHRLQKSACPASVLPVLPKPQRTSDGQAKGCAVLTLFSSSLSRWRSCCFVVAQTDPHRGFSWGRRTSSDLSVRPKPEERVPVVLRSSHMWN